MTDSVYRLQIEDRRHKAHGMPYTVTCRKCNNERPINPIIPVVTGVIYKRLRDILIPKESKDRHVENTEQ